MTRCEANLALGFRDDEREYSSAAHMLHSLKVKSMRLITNNPRKIADLTSRGINITGRIPLVIPPNPYNHFYLETKASKSGHLIDFDGKEHLQEQMDQPIIEGMTTEQIEQVHNTCKGRRRREGGAVSMENRVAVITGATGGLGSVWPGGWRMKGHVLRCSARTASGLNSLRPNWACLPTAT